MSQLYTVLNVRPLPAVNVKELNTLNKENESNDYSCETVGGVLSNTKFIWTSNGCHFNVINTKLGSKVASWSFGSIIREFSTKVVCVVELQRSTGKLPLLVIGVDCEIAGGIICIFDITNSRVLRSIQIEEKIVSLHIIDTNQGSCPLPGPLRAFDGILSVGTAGGNVLLIDLCCQIYEEILGGFNFNDIGDEINTCQIKTIYLDDIYSLELYKQAAVRNGDHLCVHLNCTLNDDIPHFILKGPNGEDRIHVNKVEVEVSALHYCTQLGSLLVGYNFGAWQLWNLINLQLLYTSPIYEENIPVTHFAIQEPCDDPRSFCYVWVVYSNTDIYQTGIPIAVLYSLNFGAKERHEGYGVLYQDLLSCTLRFQTDLTLFRLEDDSDNLHGAYCVRLQSITKVMSKGSSIQEHPEDTFALCSIIWNEWKSQSNNRNICKTYMCLFDLNQWYKEQMPSSSNLQEQETYMSILCLNDILTENIPETKVLDMLINTNTIAQFIGSQKLEEHYYPTSLTYEFCSLRDQDFVFYKKEGVQRFLIAQIESSGPLSIVNPTHYFQQCIDIGLIPLFVDLATDLASSPDYKRELLLSVALEQQLLGYLCKCATAWSNGSYSACGCTLSFILNWGWQRALVLKQHSNQLCIPLFDYSGLRLDANTHKLLNNCTKQLNHITALFEYIIKKFTEYLLDAEVIKKQWKSLQMVSIHLEVLQWLLNVGLLPECPLSTYPREDEFNRISAPYPFESLLEYYNKRRTQLQRLSQEKFSSIDSLLFIDNLIDLECGGTRMEMEWKGDGGTGVYPPPSLQALLRTYLVDDVEISYKHCVIVYVFLDLAMSLDKSRYKPITTHLIKFPAVFKLSPSTIKITQAFWHLDHEDFATAMEQLLDPLVCVEDLKMWHHRVVMKSLLAQHQHKLALHYLQIRQPPVTHVDDVRVVLSLYVANNMLEEAFYFFRQNKSDLIKDEVLWKHFYEECNKLGKIKSIISLPLDVKEENMYLKCMQETKHPKAQDIQLLYYIQHSRFMDAYGVNEKVNLVQGKNRGLRGMSENGYPEQMIKSFINTLPQLSKNLMSICHKEKNNQWKEVPRPEPFSVFVHSTNEPARYKSTLIQTVISKAKETWMDTSTTNENSRSSCEKKWTYEEVPFVNTPKTKSLSSLDWTAAPVIFPKIVNAKMNVEEECSPTAAKKFKPSAPNLNVSFESANKADGGKSISNKLLSTPVVKRRVSNISSSHGVSKELFSIKTPQSILKTHNLSEVLLTPISTYQENEICKNNECVTPVASNFPPSKKTSWGLKPRSSIGHTPRPAVRFDVSKDLSDSSVSDTESLPDIIKETALVHSSMDEGEEKRCADSKNSSSTTDTYYSVNSSFNVNQYKSDGAKEPETGIKESYESPRLRNNKRRLDNENSASTSSPSVTNCSSELSFNLKFKVLDSTLEKEVQKESSMEYEKPRMSTRLSSRRALNRYSIQSSKGSPEKSQDPELTSLNSSFPPSLENNNLSVQNKSLLDSKTPKNGNGKPKLKGRRSLVKRVVEQNAFKHIGVSSFSEQLSTTRISFPSMLESDSDTSNISDSKIICNEVECTDVNPAPPTKENVVTSTETSIIVGKVEDEKMQSSVTLETSSEVIVSQKFKSSSDSEESNKLEPITPVVKRHGESHSYISFPSTLEFDNEMQIPNSLDLVSEQIVSSEANVDISCILVDKDSNEIILSREQTEAKKETENSKTLNPIEEWSTSRVSFPSMLEINADQTEMEILELNESHINDDHVTSTVSLSCNSNVVAHLSDTHLQVPIATENVFPRMEIDAEVETNVYSDLSNVNCFPTNSQLNIESDGDLYLDNAMYVEDSVNILEELSNTSNVEEDNNHNKSFCMEDNINDCGENVIAQTSTADCEIIELDDSSSDDVIIGSESSRSLSRNAELSEHDTQLEESDSKEDSNSGEKRKHPREVLEDSDSNSSGYTNESYKKDQEPLHSVTFEPDASSKILNSNVLDVIPEEETKDENHTEGSLLDVIAEEEEEETKDENQIKGSLVDVITEEEAKRENYEEGFLLDVIPEEPCEISKENENTTKSVQSNNDANVLVTDRSCNLNNALLEADILDTDSNKSSQSENVNESSLDCGLATADTAKLFNIALQLESSTNADLNKAIPARRSKRISSLQQLTPSDEVVVARRTRRSASVTNTTSTPNVASNINPETPLSLRRQLKSSNVSENSTPTGTKRRRPSADVKDTTSRKHVLHPANTEITPKTIELEQSSSVTTNIESYTTTRRLTRRQANLLEKSMSNAVNMDLTILENRGEGDQAQDTKPKNTSTRKLRSNSVLSNISSGSQTFSEVQSVKTKKTRNKTDVGATRMKQRSKSVDVVLQTVPEYKVKLRKTRLSSKEQEDKFDESESKKSVPVRRKRALSETLGHKVERKNNTKGKSSKDSNEELNTTRSGKKRTRDASTSK